MDLIQNWLSEISTSSRATPLCSILSPTATKQCLKQLEDIFKDGSNGVEYGEKYEQMQKI